MIYNTKNTNKVIYKIRYNINVNININIFLSNKKLNYIIDYLKFIKYIIIQFVYLIYLSIKKI